MKKDNKFFKSTLYLIIGGFITRLLGFIIKIVYTRIIKDDGISLLTIVMPTYSFFLTVSSLALPTVLAKLIAENKKRSISWITNGLFIILIINVSIMITIFFSADYIATVLLHAPESKELLIAMSLVFPIIGVGSVIKGYYNGKQRTLPYMISNILEQVLRLLLIVIIIPILYQKSVKLAVKGLILLSVLTESFSIIILLLFIPKKTQIDLKTIKPNTDMEKEILSIALPTVSGRLIGNIGYFLEPILLTNLLMINGYSKEYIMLEYGVYNAYALSILTMPAFLIAALSNSIVPEISKHCKNRNSRMVKRRIWQCTIPILSLGIIFSILIIVFRNNLLNILYNTNKGSNYIVIMAPFFTLFYLENILYSILQASNHAKSAMKISAFSVFLKTLCMCILCFLKIGIYSLVFAEILSIVLVVSLNFYVIKKEKLI